MKGILGYVAIIAILIVSVLSIYYLTQNNAETKEVTTTEGSLVSSEDFNFFLLKTFNQSIEFIAQRTAYEMAFYGGFEAGKEVLWSYNYPQMPDLEKNLQDGIRDNLPSSFTEFNTYVEFNPVDSIIIVSEQPPPNSRYFDVGGYANLSIFDGTVRSNTFSNFKIDSRAVSSYFRLLWVARQILENTSYNYSLNDANALLLLLERDFPDLGFTIQALPDDILNITIEDLCYPADVYCLAPLNSDEPRTKKDRTTGAFIPYENLKLNFKTKAVQTGTTGSSCDFSFSLDSYLGSAFSGFGVDPPVLVSVTNLGTTNDPVHLSAKVYNKSTMNQDYTLTNLVTFDDNDKPAYNAIMRINTSPYTLGGDYLVNVTGDGCTNTERFATYNLTVNPAMTFSIDVVTDPVTLINNNIRYSNTTNILVNLTWGTPENVILSVSVLPHTSSSFIPNYIGLPNFTRVLNVSTDGSGNTPTGDTLVTIQGIGGGSTVRKSFTLHVISTFDFNIFFQHNIDSGTTFRNHGIDAYLTVENTSEATGTVNLATYVENSSHNIITPSDYGITVTLVNSVVTPDSPTMHISTTQNTPAGWYLIYVNASSDYLPPKIIPFNMTVVWGCGDGIITVGQNCSDGNLNFQDCTGLGFDDGTLSCYPPGDPKQCLFNTTGCLGCQNYYQNNTCMQNGCFWCPPSWEFYFPNGAGGTWPRLVSCNGYNCSHNFTTCFVSQCALGWTGLPNTSYYKYTRIPQNQYFLSKNSQAGEIITSGRKDYLAVANYSEGDYCNGNEYYTPWLTRTNEVSSYYLFGGLWATGPSCGVTINSSFIWEYGSMETRTIECCNDAECLSRNKETTTSQTVDPVTGERSYNSKMLKIWDNVTPYAIVLNEQDVEDGTYDWPFSNFRKAWCGDSNINCLLCAPAIVGGTLRNEWYVCKGDRISSPYEGVIVKNVSLTKADNVSYTWIDDMGRPQTSPTYYCDYSGNWTTNFTDIYNTTLSPSNRIAYYFPDILVTNITFP